MATRLIGRVVDLKTLNDRAQSGKGELVVMWGRRRVGKTYVLHAFVDGRPAVHMGAIFEGMARERARLLSGPGRLDANRVAGLRGLRPGTQRLVYGGCKDGVAGQPGATCFSILGMYA